ncbi:MucBP domain-containing protein [Streptococcus dysgalactiae subsp. equisimilis]|uniref:MucBP domain-containing protein n=1 Tax=Streptococcus dysgalactiae TaxID=1334 RepID=UPI003EBEA5FE
MFKRERSRYSIRKNKCYGACSVFLGLTILTLAMAGGNVKADSAVSVEGEPAVSTLVALEGTAQHLPTETSAGYSLESDEEGLETNTEMAPASLEAQGATPRAIEGEVVAGQDVSDKLTTIKAEFEEVEESIDPNNGQHLYFESVFDIADDVKQGDYFYLSLSKEITPFGDDKSHQDQFESLHDGEEIIAVANYEENSNRIKYTFTDKITSKTNINGFIRLPLFIDRYAVPNSQNILPEVKIGKTIAKTSVNVDYTNLKLEKDNLTANVLSIITSIDDKNKEIEWTIYINPLEKKLPNTKLELFSYDASKDVKEETSVNFLKDFPKTIEIYKVPENYNLPESFGIEYEKLVKENVNPVLQSEMITIDLKDKLKSGNAYVLKLKTVYNPDKPTALTAVLSGRGSTLLSPHGTIAKHEFDEGQAGAKSLEAVGFFVEKHIFKTVDELGNTIKEDVVIESSDSGKVGSEFSTEKSKRFPEYSLKEVMSTTGTKFSSTGEKVSNLYIKNKVQEVTYLYQRQIVTKGSFQEHHDYYDMERAFDGTILKRTKNTNLSYSGQIQSGKETEHYTTQKHEQDDYQFLTVTEPKNDPIFDKSGNRVEGNFVANVKKEVTYEYEKVNQPGRFEDTHKYFINYVDANGQVIRTEEVNSHTNQYQEGMPEWDEYVAYPLEKDGFVFKTTSDDKLTNLGNFDKETKITRGSYTPGEMQHITYNYYKDVLLSGTVIATYGEFGTGQPLSDAVFATYGKTDKELPNGAGQLNDDYVTVAKDIPGYHLVEQPENAKGKVSDGVTYVHYLYQKDKEALGTVIVRHIEFGTGKELAPSEYATYDDVPAGVPAGSTVAGTGYETKPAQIDGYDLVEVPEDNYGNVFEGITRLTYVYKKQAQLLGTVIVRHVEFGTGKELAPSEYATYDDVPAGVPSGSTVAGTGYETKPAQIDGYDLIEVPEDDYGNVFEGITRLTYVYKKQAQPLGTVIVRHIEFGTGKELAPSEYATYDDVPAGVPAGSTVAGTGYETKPAQIDGYDLVEVPEDDYGNVFEGITRLTYVYKKQIITGQGEIIDFELESNGDESGQNEQPDEISEHGPLVELEYPSQEGMSGENAGTVEIEENAPIVELDYPSQEGMSGENAGTVEIEESSPIVELDYPSQEGMSGENAGTVEVEENAPIVELDYPSQEGMSGENAGTVEIEESSPIVELDYPSQEGMSGENAGTVEVEENAPIVELDYPSQEGMSGENTGQQTIEEDTPTVTIEEKPVVKPVSSQPSKEELPATGERSETAVTVLGLALSALGLTFIRKRKQN